MEVTIERGLFNGLYSYEIALLAMGAVLFLIAAWSLVRAISSGGSLRPAMVILPFVLVFVGYPSLAAVKFDNAATEVTKLAHSNTSTLTPDQKAVAEQQISLIAERAKTPAEQAVAANAYRALGETEKAYSLAEKIDTGKPPAAVSTALVPVFEQKLKETLQSTSLDPAAKVEPAKAEEIQKVVKQLDSAPSNLSAPTHVSIAHAYAVLGDKSKAEASISKAQAVQPTVHVDPKLLEKLSAIH
jgi:hypothetical protein